jgi:hypothetical protein
LTSPSRRETTSIASVTPNHFTVSSTARHQYPMSRRGLLQHMKAFQTELANFEQSFWRESKSYLQCNPGDSDLFLRRTWTALEGLTGACQCLCHEFSARFFDPNEVHKSYLWITACERSAFTSRPPCVLHIKCNGRILSTGGTSCLLLSRNIVSKSGSVFQQQLCLMRRVLLIENPTIQI